MQAIRTAAMWAGLATIWVGSTHAEVQVEGDQALLELVLAAQRANSVSYVRGALKAKVVIEYPPMRTTVESRVVWDGPNTYWSFERGLKGIKSNEVASGEMIETPQRQFVYLPNQKLLESSLPKIRGYGQEFELRPDQSWFRTKNVVNFGRLIDPAFDAGSLAGFRVRKSNDDAVIERTSANGKKQTITVALDKGANVRAFATTLPSGADDMSTSATLEWEQHASGVWWLKSCVAERIKGKTKGSNVKYSLSVSEFDPAPRIESGRFTWQSLKVPDGTQVDEFTEFGKPPRTYVIGKVVKDPQAELDKAAETLRKGRFATGGR